MSPLTAMVKCLPYGGQSNIESKAVKAVASSQDGVKRAYYLEGGE
jgi:hypothetical protein